MKKILILIVTIFLSFVLLSAFFMMGNNDNTNTEDPEVEDKINFNNKIETGYKKLEVYEMTEIKRNLPKKISNGGLHQYPTFDKAVTDSYLKNELVLENIELYNFDSLDKNGYYYKDGVKTGQSLYKHTAADMMYGTKLSDEQTAVEKYMHVNNSSFNLDSMDFGSITTGLYAPAGEIITIEIDEEVANQNIEVYIGAMTSKANTNDLTKDVDEFFRMPLTTSSVTMNNTITYTGSPLGGLIYLYNGGARIDVDIKISGAVEATHYVVGSSTKEDLERTITSTAPLVEVDIPSQLHATMPKYRCGELTVDMMLAGIDQWEKMTAFHSYINKDKDWYHAHGVSALYDSFVPAGAAVAFVGRSYSINPDKYAINFFDTSKSDWGSYHEYGHHYGGYDIIDNAGISEVSNNLITLIGYTLYSEYSGYRTTATTGDKDWSFQNFQTEVIKNLNDIRQTDMDMI